MTARERFRAEAAKRILMFDGAFGTMIQGRQLSEADFAAWLRPRLQAMPRADALHEPRALYAR